MAKSGKGKKKFGKKRPLRVRRFWAALAIFLGVPVLTLAAFVVSFDINAYRVALAEALSAKTGREIYLEGPIAWNLSLQQGLSVGVEDVKIGNPVWTSRPLMAQIGRMRLQVDLPSLLRRKIDVIAFELSKADILLEMKPDGTGNWSFSNASPKSRGSKAEEKSGERPEGAVSFNIRSARIVDSRLGFKGKDGKLTVVDAPSLLLAGDGSGGARVRFKGSLAGIALGADLKGGALEDIGGEEWPFDLRASYGSLGVEARGHVSDHLKKVVLSAVALTAGASNLQGSVSVALDGPRPFARGHLRGTFFDLADWKKGLEDSSQGAIASVVKAAKDKISKPKARQDGRLFSTEPLPFGALKSVDAEISLAMDRLIYGVLEMQNVKAPLSLKEGRLSLAPLSALVAGSQMDGSVKIDASGSTPKLSVRLKGDGLEFSKLNLGGAEDLVSGKVDVDFDVASAGKSSRDLASHASGRASLQMDSGSLSSKGLRNLATGLLNIFLPGASLLSSPGIHCMAARYKIANGLAETEGLLVDMDTTTVAGEGTINLPDEHINMRLKTRPKGVGVGAIVPPMKIMGALTSPSFTIDAGGAVQNVKGFLIGGSAADGVPNMLEMKGKNSCAVTLDHPQLAASLPKTEAKTTLEPGHIDSLTHSVKEVGGKFLEGIGKELFGD